MAAAGLIGSGAAFNSAAADGAPSVPSRTPEQVLALEAGSTVSAFSGTVQTRSALGLPDLSSLKRLGGSRTSSASGAAAGIDLQGLVTRFLGGENTLRVWADGPQRERAQLLDPFDELDVVRNGSTLWMYSSGQNLAAKGTAPTDKGDKPAGSAAASPNQLTPDQLTPDALAKRALAAADPTTSVTLAAPSTVAGRATYSLVVTPRTSDTLVDHIVLNVDASNGVVLQCRVYARGQAEVALQTGFTSIDFARPEASRFQFTPPATATVTALPSAKDLTGLTGAASPDSTKTKPITHGTGWATIEELPGDGPAVMLSGSALDQVTTPVAGGRAIRTALFSVLVLDDGRTLVGAVPVPALVAAAGK